MWLLFAKFEGSRDHVNRVSMIGAAGMITIARQYRVYGIPHYVLIDHNGIIRAPHLTGSELSSKIGELLKKLPK